jgi:hypothetical protein
MAALVKTSGSLASGGLTLLRQEISVQSASEIALSADYVCLPAYADKWAQSLRVGAPTPLPAPSSISYYNLLSPLALASVSQNISQGLCYFSCEFSAPRDATTPVDGTNPTAPQFETTVTSTLQEQALSGSYQYTKKQWEYNNGWSLVDTQRTRNWAFEYDSETKTISASSEQLVSGDPSLFINPADIYISAPRWKTLPLGSYTYDPATRTFSIIEGALDKFYRVDTISRTDSSVSSKGQRRYSLSMQKVYEVIPVTIL